MDARNLAEFMYLSYTQSLKDKGIRSPQFHQLRQEEKAGWDSAATTATNYVETQTSATHNIFNNLLTKL